MAQDIYARLAGTTVDLHGVSGPFRTCPYCASASAYIAKGTGPHAAALNCNQCDRHLSWLSRDHLAAMAAKRVA